TGPQDRTPPPAISSFPSMSEWRKAVVRENLEHLRIAVAGTLDELRALGLNPEGWELGQVVVRGPASSIAAAVELEGVEVAVLDWEVQLVDSLARPDQPG